MLGWKPYEYYLSTPYEFFCACEGYFIKLNHQAELHRMAAWRIHQSLVQKPLGIKSFWPLWNDNAGDNTKLAPLTKEEWQEIMKTHNLN